MLEERTKLGLCGHPLSSYNPGPLCFRCSETLETEDVFEPGERVKLYGLKRVKEELGLTWAGLSIRTGMKINNLKNWGRPRNDRNQDVSSLPYEGAVLIADALGVTVDELRCP